MTTCASHGPGLSTPSLAGFPMHHMLTTKPTVFSKLKAIRRPTLILGGGIVPPPTAFARQDHHIPHNRISLRVIRITSRPYVAPSQSIINAPPPIKALPLTPYSEISLTTPAPTVRPPSRIANRNSFSIAIGVINSTDTDTLSPGITISVPSGNVTTPVTSVVRK